MFVRCRWSWRGGVVGAVAPAGRGGAARVCAGRAAVGPAGRPARHVRDLGAAREGRRTQGAASITFNNHTYALLILRYSQLCLQSLKVIFPITLLHC